MEKANIEKLPDENLESVEKLPGNSQEGAVERVEISPETLAQEKMEAIDQEVAQLEQEGERGVESANASVKLEFVKWQGVQEETGIIDKLKQIGNSVQAFARETKEKIRWFLRKEFTKQEAEKVISMFGGSLEIADLDSETARAHLEHLSFLPQPLIEFMVNKGIKINIGDADVLGMSDDPKFKQAPRGWEDKPDWSGVPGCYDADNKIVYAGSGRHGGVSRALHEFGHVGGDLLAWNNDPELIEAHKRLYSKLSEYYRQDGAGGFAGRDELVAESFAQFFRVPKNDFVAMYDEEYYLFLEKNIARATLY